MKYSKRFSEMVAMSLIKLGTFKSAIGLAFMISVYSVQAQTIYTDTLDHYSFVIDSGWVEIPKSIIDESVGFVLDQTQQQRINYSAGFQLEDRFYFEYPYILMQEHQLGLNSFMYSEIEQLFTGDDFSIGVQEAALELSELIGTTTFDDPYVDRDRNVVIFNMSSDVANVGTVNAILAMFLGRNQIVQMNFYWESSDRDYWLPAFDRMINSFRFDDGYGYDPSNVNSSQTLTSILNRMLTRGFIGGANGLILGFLVAVFGWVCWHIKAISRRKE